jgi:hypothetical protein
MLRAHLAGTQVVATATLVKILLDTVDFQTDPGFSLTSNSIVVPYTGLYECRGLVGWSSNADNLERFARIKDDTSTAIVGQTGMEGSLVGTGAEVTAEAVFAAGDSISLYGRQSSGSTLTAKAGTDGSNCWMWIEFKGVVE